MTPAHGRTPTRAARLASLITAAAIALCGLAAAPAASASSRLSEDNTGPATASWTAPKSALVGETRVLTITVDGNRSAGELAWIELERVVDFTTVPVTKQVVNRIDFALTTEPQVFTIPVDTSKADSPVYFLSYDFVDTACGSAGFSYIVSPAVVTTNPQPPTETPQDPGTDPDGDVQASVTLDRVPAKVRAGTKLRLTGKVTSTAPAGLRVAASAKTRQGWVAIGYTRTQADGRYTLRTSRLHAGMRRIKVTVPKLSVATAPRAVKVQTGKLVVKV